MTDPKGLSPRGLPGPDRTSRSSAFDHAPDAGAGKSFEIDLSPTWMDTYAAAFFAASPHEARSGGWSLCSIPEFIDRTFGFDASALHLYQRVEWTRPMPYEFEAKVEAEWSRPVGNRMELGFTTKAYVPPHLVAESLFVVRVEGPAHPFGGDRIPAIPDIESLQLTYGPSFAIGFEEVATFANLAEIHYPLHEDREFARARGHSDVLVQGGLLLIHSMRHLGVDPQGSVEIWFLKPVPVNSRLTYATASMPDSTICVLTNPDGQAATILRASCPSNLESHR